MSTSFRKYVLQTMCPVHTMCLANNVSCPHYVSCKHPQYSHTFMHPSRGRGAYLANTFITLTVKSVPHGATVVVQRCATICWCMNTSWTWTPTCGPSSRGQLQPKLSRTSAVPATEHSSWVVARMATSVCTTGRQAPSTSK